MEIIASGPAKARKIAKIAPVQCEPKWITAKRGKLSLSENTLTFADWEIPFSSIARAELSTIQSYIQKGYVLTVITDTDVTYQFGLQYDPVWENQTVLPLERNEQKVKYSSASIILRVVLGGLYLWYVVRWFYKTWPTFQRISFNTTMIISLVLFCGIVLCFDAIWARIAVRKNYRYILGSFGSVLLYSLAGLVTTVFADPPISTLVGGLTGIIVSLVGSTLGAYLAYRIGAYGDIQFQQFALTTLFSIMVIPVIGFSFGLLGGSLGILFFCSS